MALAQSDLSRHVAPSIPQFKPLALPSLTGERLTEQLRQAIYATRQGECLPPRHLKDLSQANRAELINAPKLATVLIGFPPLPPIRAQPSRHDQADEPNQPQPKAKAGCVS